MNNAGTDISEPSEAQTASDNNIEGSDGSHYKHAPVHVQLKDEGLKLTGHDPNLSKDRCGVLVKDIRQNGIMTKDTNGSVTLESQREQLAFSSQKNVSVMPFGKIVYEVA